jgi:hypothetical protein
MNIRTDNITQAITFTDLNGNPLTQKRIYQIPKSYSFLQPKFPFLLTIPFIYRKGHIFCLILFTETKIRAMHFNDKLWNILYTTWKGKRCLWNIFKMICNGNIMHRIYFI